MVDMQILKIVNYKNISKWNVPDLIHKNLSGKYENLSLYNFLERDKTVVNIQDDILYKQITVHQYGEGVSLRCEKKGKEIGTKRQFLAKKGQLIVSGIDARNGSVGLITDYLDGGIVTNDFWLFNLKNVDSKFMQLLLSLEKTSNYMQSKSNGTTNRQRVNIQDFLQIKMPVPSLEEQKSIIQKYNDAIAEAEKLEKQADEVENSSKSYFDKILEIIELSPNVSNGLNFINFSLIDLWGVDKNLCRKTIRNKKYEVRPAESLCSVGSGGTPNRANKDYYENGTIPWVKTTEVVDSYITDTEEKITEKGYENSSAKIYEPNSLIIAMYGQGQTRGRTAKLNIAASTNQACAVLYDINTNIISVDYLWYYFQNEYERIRELASGNNQPNLNAGMIKSYPVVVPPLSVQEEIVSHINEIKANVKSLRKQASDLRTKAKQDFENTVFN